MSMLHGKSFTSIQRELYIVNVHRDLALCEVK